MEERLSGADAACSGASATRPVKERASRSAACGIRILPRGLDSIQSVVLIDEPAVSAHRYGWTYANQHLSRIEEQKTRLDA